MKFGRKPSDHLICCSYCNALLPARANFCSSCNKRVERKKNGELEAHTNPSSNEAQEEAPTQLISSPRETASADVTTVREAPIQIERAHSSPTVPAPPMLKTRKQAPVRLNVLWPTIIISSAVATGLVNVVFTDTIVRPVVVFWFLLICPGMMVVRLLQLKEPVAEWTLALALSLAIDAIVASILIYMGAWSPTSILAILIGFSVGGEIVQLISTHLAALPVSRWFTSRRSQKPVVLLPLLFTLLFIASLAAASTWSPVYTALSEPTGSPSQVQRSAVSHASIRPTTKVYPTSAPTTPVVDAVFVVDNVNFISYYDPRGDRFAAAQLFVGLAPPGSRVGIVKITSSTNPTMILNLQDIKSSSDRKLIESRLSNTFFGAVDPNPTAYFIPALQTAGNMLRRALAADRKYVIVITDELAYSGDQNACPPLPDDFHNWFCEVNLLAKQGVSVILLGFTNPAGEGSLLPTKQYIEARGGTVLPVTDSTNLVQYLTPVYSDLLKGIRPKS